MIYKDACWTLTNTALKSDCIPIVGTVLNTSPIWSLYNIVVLPAASRPAIEATLYRKLLLFYALSSAYKARKNVPSITTRISRFPNSLSKAFLQREQEPNTFSKFMTGKDLDRIIEGVPGTHCTCLKAFPMRVKDKQPQASFL